MLRRGGHLLGRLVLGGAAARVREQVLLSLRQIQQIASAVAQLDVLAGFAEVARLRGYVCPEISDEGMLQIDEGRHPVLEQALISKPFVPNDTQLESVAQQICDRLPIGYSQIRCVSPRTNGLARLRAYNVVPCIGTCCRWHEHVRNTALVSLR